MSPRQARRERREAERKAKKAEIKRLKAAQSQNPDCEVGDPASFSAPPPASHAGFVSQQDEATTKLQTRREINRANAQHSTGPRTQAGKLASSRNSLKHGLASGTLIIPGEDPAAFEELQAALLEEHQPATETETLLIIEMARSWWLMQRAIRLQNDCFAGGDVDEKRLSLFLRYQTTHERAFHKALNALLKLKQIRDRHALQAKRSANPGFVSQNDANPASNAGFVSQNSIARPPNAPSAVAEAA